MNKKNYFEGLARASQHLFDKGQPRIGFADVGSGGPLKSPWDAMPGKLVERLEFDPETSAEPLPLCVSNESGEKDFYIARDPRGSSLHRPVDHFIQRFGMDSLLVEREIQVQCKTLDDIVSSRGFIVDALDVNTEGHDFRVLQGSEKILGCGSVKVAKIEFELAEVWNGQGYFADIDQLMREKGFELCHWEHDILRQKSSQSYWLDPGEPVWGKAWYVPSIEAWKNRRESLPKSDWVEQCYTAAAIYVVCGFLGRAFEMLDLVSDTANEPREKLQKILAREERRFRLGAIMRHLVEACRWLKRSILSNQ